MIPERDWSKSNHSIKRQIYCTLSLRWVLQFIKTRGFHLQKEDRHQPSNYCPYRSHLSCGRFLNTYFKASSRPILCDSFRKCCSYETKLIETIDKEARHLFNGCQVDMILLDFGKASDKVPCSRLLYKLDFYGVRGKVNN